MLAARATQGIMADRDVAVRRGIELLEQRDHDGLVVNKGQRANTGASLLKTT